MKSPYMMLFRNPLNSQRDVSRSREIRAKVVQRRDVGSVRLSVDRSETGNMGRPATAHNHLSGRRRSVHLPDKDINKQPSHSSRHLRDVGVHGNTNVVSAVAREKEEREIEESHHRQRRRRFDP